MRTIAWLAGSMLIVAIAAVLLQRLAMRQMFELRYPDSRRRMSIAPQHWLGDAICALLLTQILCLLLVLTARPVAAGLLTLALTGLLIIINNAKFKVLREPLVLIDIFELELIVKHPHLYLPFLPVRIITLVVFAIIAAVSLLIYLEPPLTSLRTWVPLLFLLGLFFTPIGLFFGLYTGKWPAASRLLLTLCPVSHNAARDGLHIGPLTSAFLHPLLANELLREESFSFLGDPARRPTGSRWPEPFEAKLKEIEEAARDCNAILPDFILIQAESFNDIRTKMRPEKRKLLTNLLPNWESLAARGQVLPTPSGAYGAYTIRSEFTMLTGLNRENLGPWGFNPYRLAAENRLWSLARFFNNLGYHTLCLHPYDKTFYQRHKVIPNLGFDAFLGPEALGHLEKFGPYTSDLALATEANRLIAQSPSPVFCFIITMESHGPWLPDRLTNTQLQDVLGEIAGNPLFSIPRQMYLAHLKNMDRMFGALEPENGAGRSVWAYGDHVPFGYRKARQNLHQNA